MSGFSGEDAAVGRVDELEVNRAFEGALRFGPVERFVVVVGS